MLDRTTLALSALLTTTVATPALAQDPRPGAIPRPSGGSVHVLPPAPTAPLPAASPDDAADDADAVEATDATPSDTVERADAPAPDRATFPTEVDSDAPASPGAKVIHHHHHHHHHHYPKADEGTDEATVTAETSPEPEKARPYRINDWDTEYPVPPGYELSGHIRGGLVGGGLGMLGGAWLLSSVAATIGSENETSSDFEGGVSAEDWNALYVPVFGPWIAMATLDAEGAGISLLALDGLVQAGGTAMFIAGLASRKYDAIRVDFDEVEVGIAPTPGGFVASGSF